MMSLNRRRFLMTLGGGMAAGLGWALANRHQHHVLHTDTSPLQQRTQNSLLTLSETKVALGTHMTLTVLHEDKEHASEALHTCFAELEQIESLMSLYRSESQISQLNRRSLLNDPHPDFCRVLQTAQNISSLSQGAFDITVQPLWELHACCQQEERSATQSELQRTRKLVDWQKVKITSKQLSLLQPKMKITLNGIAQGYATDKVKKTLQQFGIEHALIDAGEIGSLGTKQKAEAWRVGIQHPRDEEAYLSLAELDNRCLATSGDYATTFGGDYKSHHLFDPHTGNSPSELSSVSIVAPSGMWADALSTAVFVMGWEQGLQLVSTLQHVDALLMSKEGDMYMTEGFPVISEEQWKEQFTMNEKLGSHSNC